MKPDPAAQCRFFTATDACRLALCAYFAAAKEIDPPPGEPWLVDGDPYASASDFADAFIGHVQARVGLHALDACGEFMCGGNFNPVQLAAEMEPDKMATLVAELRAVDAEFEDDLLGQKMQDLPPTDNHLHNHPADVENHV